MSSDDELDAMFMSLSEKLSDPTARSIFNRLQDNVSTESMYARRVDQNEDHLGFAEANAQVAAQRYTDIVRDEADVSAEQAYSLGGRADDERRRVDDAWFHTSAPKSGIATQHASTGSEEIFDQAEPDIDWSEWYFDTPGADTEWPDGLFDGLDDLDGLHGFSVPSAGEPPILDEPQMGGESLPISVPAVDGENAQAPARHTTSEDSRLLEDYKTYIFSKLRLSDLDYIKVRGLLENCGWPTVWQSLDTIKDCEGGLSWTWSAVDSHLLKTLKETGLFSYGEMAEYFFIGLRASQCEEKYEAVMAKGKKG